MSKKKMKTSMWTKSEETPERKEMIYKIHSMGYPYRMIGELLDLTKQYVYELYAEYEKDNEKKIDKTCALCRKHDRTVKTHYRIPLCNDCYDQAKRIRGNKWKREHEKD